MTALLASDNYPLQPARDMSLAHYIGCSLARDSLPSDRRSLLERMRAHLNSEALAQCNAAYSDAVQS